MSDFPLLRRDPGYVSRAKHSHAMELARQNGERNEEMSEIADALCKAGVISETDGFWEHTEIGSVVCSNRPGDGSAREQAASCQRVLGGLANICVEYATKRYRSNLVNWGMIPFTWTKDLTERLSVGDFVYVPGVRKAVLECAETVPAYILKTDGSVDAIVLDLKALSKDEADIVAAGSLINYYSC